MTPTSRYSLLVVDDEPDLRTLYELTLAREGYDIETSGTVEDALQRLADRRYSAVITDMRLPDGSGLDLLRYLEDAGRAEKTVVITAYGSAENAVEALKAGAFDYLTKPVDLRQFRAVVASALGRAPAGAVTRADPASLPSAAAAPPAAGNATPPSAAGAARGPSVRASTTAAAPRAATGSGPDGMMTGTPSQRSSTAATEGTWLPPPTATMA